MLRVISERHLFVVPHRQDFLLRLRCCRGASLHLSFPWLCNMRWRLCDSDLSLLGMEWPQQAVSVSINHGGKVTHAQSHDLRWLLAVPQQSSVVPPHGAFYHSRCLIAKMDDMREGDVSVTVWTVHEMAHRPCCNHDSREKTENTLPSPAASQGLNEVAACLSALWGESQITDNEAVPFQDIFEI